MCCSIIFTQVIYNASQSEHCSELVEFLLAGESAAVGRETTRSGNFLGQNGGSLKA
jgi:hypothetical protein